VSAMPVVVVRQAGREPLFVEVHGHLEVGRDCDGLLLADAQVSRRHIELRVTGGRLTVTDIGSRNGTVVDGKPLTGPVELRAGMRALLGTTTVELADSGGFSDRQTEIGESAEPEDLRRTSIDVVASAADDWRPAPSPLTGSTMTIVFSDIESSTELATSIGDRAWYELLARHNRMMRDEVARFRGSEIKSQGDGFMMTFPSARSAVLFGVAVQRVLDRQLRTKEGRALRVRLGMHTGEAVADPAGDLFGRHVIIAARIANLAVGGEILVSSIVHEITDSTGDLIFGPARRVLLKGVPGEHMVHEVDWRESTVR
jgi:class 3 adenylate cyclase